MDKGSRQISIVTLGKGMALVVGYGTLEDRDGTVGGRDDGCYPFRGAAGCRPSFTGLRKLIGLGSWAFRRSKEEAGSFGFSWVLCSISPYS